MVCLYIKGRRVEVLPGGADFDVDKAVTSKKEASMVG